MNLIKRLSRLFSKRSYLTNVKPCPCCGGRHILFKPLTFFVSFVCDDCGFMVEDPFADDLLYRWEKLPRKKEDNHDSHAD